MPSRKIVWGHPLRGVYRARGAPREVYLPEIGELSGRRRRRVSSPESSRATGSRPNSGAQVDVFAIFQFFRVAAAAEQKEKKRNGWQHVSRSAAAVFGHVFGLFFGAFLLSEMVSPMSVQKSEKN